MGAVSAVASCTAGDVAVTEYVPRYAAVASVAAGHGDTAGFAVFPGAAGEIATGIHNLICAVAAGRGGAEGGGIAAGDASGAGATLPARAAVAEQVGVATVAPLPGVAAVDTGDARPAVPAGPTVAG
ncbi:hypothetical protein B1T43_01840 [Mycobacterium kansasii]|nr:hypothetical protein B1T43_01840 [Mycobacterium kansasii]